LKKKQIDQGLYNFRPRQTLLYYSYCDRLDRCFYRLVIDKLQNNY